MSSIEFYHINKRLHRLNILSSWILLFVVVFLTSLVIWAGWLSLASTSVNEKPTCPEGVTINVANEELVKQLKNNKNVYLILKAEEVKK